MSFRLAGIRILQGCAPHIRKVLKEEELYLFSSRYKEDSDHTLSLNINDTENSFIESLYNIDCDNNSIEVTVNAIVGKNGEGKSTIVDILIRLLNNFSYIHISKSNLTYIDGVKAILYYEIDCEIYAIECNERNIRCYKNGIEIPHPDIHQHPNFSIFHTLVINYSLYAYTPSSLNAIDANGNSWIDGVFIENGLHPNHIAICPMRHKGNIDINREEYLSKQRLMSLLAKKSSKSRIINASDKAVGVAFSLTNKHPFIEITLGKYFREHFHDNIDWEYAKCNLLDQTSVIIKRIIPLLASNRELLKLGIGCMRFNKRRIKSDLSNYIDRLFNDDELNKTQELSINHQKLIQRFLRRFNYILFYRILLVTKIWNELTNTDQFNIKGEDLNKILKDPYRPRNAAMLYLIYEFISFIEVKPYIEDHSFRLFNDHWLKNIVRYIQRDLRLLKKSNNL